MCNRCSYPGLWFADILKNKYPIGSDVHSRLQRIFEIFKKDHIPLMGPLDGPGYTIIHNDLHVNNMMFQYEKVSAISLSLPTTKQLAACTLSI